KILSSADQLVTELHQLIKQTQEERSRSGHNLTENKISPYYRAKLRGLHTTAKADVEAEGNILGKALGKIAKIKLLLAERWIAAKIGSVHHSSLRELCGQAWRQGGCMGQGHGWDEQWILVEVVSYSHATNKCEVDDIDEEGKERHTLSRRRIIPLSQWKANPETDPEDLFQKEQQVLALYPQTTCFYRALIHTPPQRPQDDYSVLFEDTSCADGYSPPLNMNQRYVVACKEPKKK
uniref:SAGA-associated factor 29 n=1 Tax=Sciurus vulgaris TaxID=55149 RepID=A0A8D2B8L7_SCIVU